jgi:hypothetical protein
MNGTRDLSTISIVAQLITLLCAHPLIIMEQHVANGAEREEVIFRVI